jgi:hypothetical protein
MNFDGEAKIGRANLLVSRIFMFIILRRRSSSWELKIISGRFAFPIRPCGERIAVE